MRDRAALAVGMMLAASGVARAQALLPFAATPAGCGESWSALDGCGVNPASSAPNAAFIAGVLDRLAAAPPAQPDPFAGFERLTDADALPALPSHAEELWLHAAAPTGWSGGAPGEATVVGIDQTLGDQVRVGVAGGFSPAVLGFGGSGDEFAGNAWQAATYAAAADGNWRVRGIASYAYYDLATERAVPFDTGLPRAEYNADHVEAVAEISYVSFASDGSAVEPYLAAGVTWVQVDGYQALGSAFGVAPQDEAWPYSQIGLRLAGSAMLGEVAVRPSLDLGWRHVYGATDPATLAAADSGTVALMGLPIARDSLIVQAGFDAAFTSGWRTSVSYTGDLAEQARQHRLTGGVALPF